MEPAARNSEVTLRRLYSATHQGRLFAGMFPLCTLLAGCASAPTEFSGTAGASDAPLPGLTLRRSKARLLRCFSWFTLFSLIDDFTLEKSLLDLGLVYVRCRNLEQVVIEHNHVGPLARFD